MGTKKTSQQSHTTHFNPTPMDHGEYMLDFLIKIQNWDYPERTMVSSTLEENDEYVEKEARIEIYKPYVEKHIIKCLDERNARILANYISLLEEQKETAVCMGDMVACDLITAIRTEDKEK